MRSRPPTMPRTLADRGRWVREVTPICRHSDDWFDRQPSPQKARGYDRYLAKIAVRIRSVNAKIMALRPPIGEKRKIRALGALFKTDERLIAEISAAAQRRDWMTYETIRDKLLGVFERESRLFERLGASACTIGSSASR
jgi:hypothetical protein